MAIILPNEKLVLNAYAVLVDETPGNAALEEHLAYIAANGESAYLAVLNNVFAAQSNATLATTMLANLGLSDIFTQAEAEAFLAGNAANRVGAMINLANALYNYAGSDAAIVAAHNAYVTAIAGSYDYSTDPANVNGADLSGEIINDGQTFTLTNDIDVATANIFNSTPVYTPGGNDFINSLQDEDQLTGTGTNPTLNVTLGSVNDAAEGTVTPILNGIETVNVQITGDAAGINFQDATGLETLNVTRITATNPEVTFDDLDSTVTNIGLSNSTRDGIVNFDYREDVLTATDDTLNVTLSNVRMNEVNIQEGGDTNEDQGYGFETVNITVNGGANVDNLSIAHPETEGTEQTINLVANANTEINEFDTEAEHMTIVANADVLIAQEKAPVGLMADISAMEENEGLENESLQDLTISGAGNVSIVAEWEASDADSNGLGLAVNAGTMTGDLHLSVINESWSGADDLLNVTSGSGDDLIAVSDSEGHEFAGTITTNAGDDAVSINGDVGNAGDVAEGDNSGAIVTGEGDDTVTVNGDLNAVGDDELNNNQTFGEATASSISTGNGDDTVVVGSLNSDTDWNNGPSLLDQSDDTYFVKGASIDTGAGADDVTLVAVAEGASVTTGEGADALNVTLLTTGLILEGDTQEPNEVNLDGTENVYGAMVDLGAGDDVATFSEEDGIGGGPSINSFTIVGADAVLDGGVGADVLDVNALDHVTVAKQTIDETDTNATILGFETANLTILNQVNAAASAATGVEQNEGWNEWDGQITVDVMRFDDSLQTLNLTSEEQALRNLVDNETWRAGSETTFDLMNLRSGIEVNLSANEATGVDSGDLVDDSEFDVELNVDMADASGDADTFTLNVTPANVTDEAYTIANDVDLDLSFNGTTTDEVADVDNLIENVVINLEAAGSHYIDVNGFGDDQFNNSADNDGSFMQWRNLDPVNNRLQSVYNAIADKTVFGQGYEVATSFTLTGTAAGDDVTINDITADVITTSGDANITVNIGKFENNYTITTEGGDDVLNMVNDLVDDEDALNAGDGNDTLVIYGANNMGFDDGVQGENDEVWANKYSIENLDILSDGTENTVVLDEEANDKTGIQTIHIVGDQDQTTHIILGEDWQGDLNLETDAGQGFTVFDMTNNQDTVFTDLNVSLFADDGAAFSLNDAYNRQNVSIDITINDGDNTVISADDEDAVDDGDVDLIVTAGDIDSIHLTDSGEDSTISVVVDDAWSDSSLVINAADILDNDDDTTTGGMTFDGSAETDAELVVDGTQNDDTITGGQVGDVINGNDGDDTIDGDTFINSLQVDTVTFAATYEAGDTVSVTIDGSTLTATIGVDGVTGTAVAAAFADVYADLVDNLPADNITLAGVVPGWVVGGNTAANANVLTITGETVGTPFVTGAATNNASDATAQVQTLSLTVTDGGDWSADVVFDGNTYHLSQVGNATTTAGAADYDEFAAAVTAAGGTLTYTTDIADAGAGDEVLTITGPADGSAFPLITQATVVAGVTAATLAKTDGVANSNTDQANPTVTTVVGATTELGGDDTINGGAGDDTINGMIGDDTISGGTGDDTITGGAGSDALDGGAGHDVFVYNAATESSGLNVDTIANFEGGVVTAHGAGTADDYTTGDVIDLTSIATDLGFAGVSFIGTFADDTVADTQLVSGSANLQVVYVTGDNALYVDVDASGDINDGDMVIELVGVTGTLTQANFNPAATLV